MRMLSGRALALVAVPSMMLACASDNPPPPSSSPPPIGSTPPATPVPPLPPPPPPPTVTAGTGGGGTAGAGGTARPPDGGRRPDMASVADAPPAVPLCATTVTAMGNDPNIDDFNDNNVELRMADGRMGSWASYNNMTAMVDGQTMVGVPELVMAAAGMATNRAIRFRGTEMDPAGWGGQVEASFVPGTDCYDASAYGGIALQIRGLQNTRVKISVYTADVRNLGEMRYGQWYGYEHSFGNANPNNFTTLMLRWNQFTPGGLAPEPRMLDPKLVYGIVVQALSRPALGDAGASPGIGMFDFTVDNIRFLPRMP